MKEEMLCTSCGEFKGTLVEKNKNAGTTVYSPIESFTLIIFVYILYVSSIIRINYMSFLFPSLSFMHPLFRRSHRRRILSPNRDQMSLRHNLLNQPFLMSPGKPQTHA